MRRSQLTFEYVTNFVYIIGSFSLLFISLAMVGYALWEVWMAMHEKVGVSQQLLDAIGNIVVAMAVFDVSKYLMEEEVLRDRELRSAREARQTLTKFLVIITIAVTLEALIFILDSGTTDITTLIYPTLLLIAVALLIVALGVFQRLSVTTERENPKPPSG